MTLVVLLRVFVNEEHTNTFSQTSRIFLWFYKEMFHFGHYAALYQTRASSYGLREGGAMNTQAKVTHR